ncbi:hypothetical protein [Neptuniibacter sp. QD37_11]|uniref:hypothetical protein n=1 Tax=Neptuniibacter sp. QD37_11 TaxID=3398209 RepID=UPI0039F6336D
MNVFRKISPRRARFLRKRGEDVRWIVRENSYMWSMQYKYLNRWNGDRGKVRIP